MLDKFVPLGWFIVINTVKHFAGTKYKLKLLSLSLCLITERYLQLPQQITLLFHEECDSITKKNIKVSWNS